MVFPNLSLKITLETSGNMGITHVQGQVTLNILTMAYQSMMNTITLHNKQEHQNLVWSMGNCGRGWHRQEWAGSWSNYWMCNNPYISLSSADYGNINRKKEELWNTMVPLASFGFTGTLTRMSSESAWPKEYTCHIRTLYPFINQKIKAMLCLQTDIQTDIQM